MALHGRWEWLFFGCSIIMSTFNEFNWRSWTHRSKSLFCFLINKFSSRALNHNQICDDSIGWQNELFYVNHFYFDQAEAFNFDTDAICTNTCWVRKYRGFSEVVQSGSEIQMSVPYSAESFAENVTLVKWRLCTLMNISRERTRNQALEIVGNY